MADYSDSEAEAYTSDAGSPVPISQEIQSGARDIPQMAGGFSFPNLGKLFGGGASTSDASGPSDNGANGSVIKYGSQGNLTPQQRAASVLAGKGDPQAPMMADQGGAQAPGGGDQAPAGSPSGGSTPQGATGVQGGQQDAPAYTPGKVQGGPEGAANLTPQDSVVFNVPGMIKGFFDPAWKIQQERAAQSQRLAIQSQTMQVAQQQRQADQQRLSYGMNQGDVRAINEMAARYPEQYQQGIQQGGAFFSGHVDELNDAADLLSRAQTANPDTIKQTLLQRYGDDPFVAKMVGSLSGSRAEMVQLSTHLRDMANAGNVYRNQQQRNTMYEAPGAALAPLRPGQSDPTGGQPYNVNLSASIPTADGSSKTVNLPFVAHGTPLTDQKNRVYIDIQKDLAPGAVWSSMIPQGDLRTYSASPGFGNFNAVNALEKSYGSMSYEDFEKSGVKGRGGLISAMSQYMAGISPDERSLVQEKLGALNGKLLAGSTLTPQEFEQFQAVIHDRQSAAWEATSPQRAQILHQLGRAGVSERDAENYVPGFAQGATEDADKQWLSEGAVEHKAISGELTRKYPKKAIPVYDPTGTQADPENQGQATGAAPQNQQPTGPGGADKNALPAAPSGAPASTPPGGIRPNNPTQGSLYAPDTAGGLSPAGEAQMAITRNMGAPGSVSITTTDGGQKFASLADVRRTMASAAAASPLLGYVPPDGAEYGIHTGSAAEWSRFMEKAARAESGFSSDKVHVNEKFTEKNGQVSEGLLSFSKTDLGNYPAAAKALGLEGQKSFTQEQMDDPALQARFAAEVFAQNIKRKGSIRAGVGATQGPIARGEVNFADSAGPLPDAPAATRAPLDAVQERSNNNGRVAPEQVQANRQAFAAGKPPATPSFASNGLMDDIEPGGPRAPTPAAPAPEASTGSVWDAAGGSGAGPANMAMGAKSAPVSADDKALANTREDVVVNRAKAAGKSEAEIKALLDRRQKAIGALGGTGSAALDSADAFVRSAANTATFGLADRAAAGVAQATGLPMKGGDSATSQVAISDKEATTHPIATGAGAVAGGVAQAAALPTGAFLGKTLGSTVLRSGATGAALAGASSAGEDVAHGQAPNLSKAAETAAIGGAVGAAAPVVAGAVGVAARTAAKALGWGADGEKIAGELLSKGQADNFVDLERKVARGDPKAISALAKSGVTPDAVSAAAQAEIQNAEVKGLRAPVGSDTEGAVAQRAAKEGPERVQASVFQKGVEDSALMRDVAAVPAPEKPIQTFMKSEASRGIEPEQSAASQTLKAQGKAAYAPMGEVNGAGPAGGLFTKPVAADLAEDVVPGIRQALDDEGYIQGAVPSLDVSLARMDRAMGKEGATIGDLHEARKMISDDLRAAQKAAANPALGRSGNDAFFLGKAREALDDRFNGIVTARLGKEDGDAALAELQRARGLVAEYHRTVADPAKASRMIDDLVRANKDDPQAIFRWVNNLSASDLSNTGTKQAAAPMAIKGIFRKANAVASDATADASVRQAAGQVPAAMRAAFISEHFAPRGQVLEPKALAKAMEKFTSPEYGPTLNALGFTKQMKEDMQALHDLAQQQGRVVDLPGAAHRQALTALMDLFPSMKLDPNASGRSAVVEAVSNLLTQHVPLGGKIVQMVLGRASELGHATPAGMLARAADMRGAEVAQHAGRYLGARVGLPVAEHAVAKGTGAALAPQQPQQPQQPGGRRQLPGTAPLYATGQRQAPAAGRRMLPAGPKMY